MALICLVALAEMIHKVCEALNVTLSKWTVAKLEHNIFNKVRDYCKKESHRPSMKERNH